MPSTNGGALVRLVIISVALGVIAAVAYRIGLARLPHADHRATLVSTGLASGVSNRLDPRFTDADNNLVADTPTQPSDWLDPAVLTFSYIATDEPAKYAAVFVPLVTHLSQVVGRPVEYVQFDSTRAQLLALKSGSLHVAGLNTGSVPIAVNAAGFVPVATPGHEHGMIGYTMQLIVPRASPIQKVADLKGRTIAFTDPGSNSGYKAALVILMGDFGLEPERDYLWVFSRGHLESIKGVASGRYEAAAVASDLVARSGARGEIPGDAIRVIYSSEPFPTAALGHLYSLKPELASRVREALFSFDWTGTSVAAEFAGSGADRFVPIDYKSNFALVRRIDDAVGFRHVIE